MNEKEMAVCEAMISIQREYFPKFNDLATFAVEPTGFDGIKAQALFGDILKVTLYYGDPRVLEPKYRMGLVPVVAHEIAHFIDPVDPERVMRQRLPPAMMELWDALLEGGYASCSMTRP